MFEEVRIDSLGNKRAGNMTGKTALESRSTLDERQMIRNLVSVYNCKWKNSKRKHGERR